MSTKTSETVTVTTASKMPFLAINSGVLKTPSVWLKIVQTILGAIGLGLSMQEVTGYFRMDTMEMRLQILVIFACLLVTFLLLVSSLVSSMAANMIPKTIFEMLYHISASILYLVVTPIYTWHFNAFEDEIRDNEAVAISVLGIMNGLLYCASSYFSYKSYKSS